MGGVAVHWFYPFSTREGHAAALVDDVIYVFGGRGVDGKSLGDPAAFKISSEFLCMCTPAIPDFILQIKGGTCSRIWALHPVRSC
jgi:hypothetical protein